MAKAAPEAEARHRVFGVRHHGPGSARALLRALADYAPDAILIEGPPDADALVPLAGDEAMVPPVALLVWARDAPGRAAAYPFAEFSPEWQALRWAAAHGVEARFMDLPQTHQLGPPDAGAGDDGEEPTADDAGDTSPPPWQPPDPLGTLAEALGDDDPEAAWERLVELRADPTAIFEAVAALIGELRAAHEAEAGEVDAPWALREARREAFMRETIRGALAAGRERVAVVCGAWHAPALASLAGVTADRARLRGLPKTKVDATWIPWTHGRLAQRSGYGAGVSCPGFYAHVFRSGGDAGLRWVSEAARLLRERGVDVSPAHVIHTVRLADALAALRDATTPGLSELRDAMRAALCDGDDAPMLLVRDALEVGEVLGAVPESAPRVPLAADLERLQRALRLKPTPEPRRLELDLREESGRAKSALLHRLELLGVPWGEPEGTSGRGTFKEAWRLVWEPELAVRVVEAALWGNTVEDAASACVVARGRAEGLVGRAALLDRALTAELDAAAAALVPLVDDAAATAADVAVLMDALPALARVLRYGDVRGTAAARLRPVVDALIERVLVGLPPACASLDDGAAEAMVKRVAEVQGAVTLLDTAGGAGEPERRAAWSAVLAGLADDDGMHGLLRGVACRLLLDQGALDQDALSRHARRTFSPGTPPTTASLWLGGLLRGSALLLVELDALWGILDAWLSELTDAAFVEVLPLVRRAFADFAPGERRAMAARLGRRRGAGAGAGEQAPADAWRGVDRARAELVLPVLRELLGPFEEPTS